MDRPKKTRICIVSPYCYPLFNPTLKKAPFGGWEVRTYQIARGLASTGRFDVNVVVWDHGQPHIEQYDGVTIYSWQGHHGPEGLHMVQPAQEVNAFQPSTSPSPEIAIPPTVPTDESKPWIARIRLQTKLWLTSKLDYRQRLMLTIPYDGLREAAGALYGSAQKLWDLIFNSFGAIGKHLILNDSVAIYDEVNADIYMVLGNHERAATVGFFCRKRGKKYMFLAGSDMDFNPSYLIEPEKSDIYATPAHLMVYAIQSASLIVVQNEHQADLLKQYYNRSSVLIRNPIDLELKFPKNENADTILWVGSADERVKRPSLFGELIRRLPEYTFKMLLVPTMGESYQQFLTKAGDLSNLTILGRTPFQEVERYFSDAKLFVNTSSFEGFPNTFLQAGKYGVPIVSAKVDPGGMLSRHGCGVTCNDDVDSMINNIHEFMTKTDRYQEASHNCQTYVRAYHDKNLVIRDYEQAIDKIMSNMDSNRTVI